MYSVTGRYGNLHCDRPIAGVYTVTGDRWSVHCDNRIWVSVHCTYAQRYLKVERV